MNPMEIFETMRDKAMLMAQTAFMESGLAWPDQETIDKMVKPLIGIGIAAATEHYGSHPEHLALAIVPICTLCREPIASLQVGIDPARDPENQTDPIKIAWPCGHLQS